MAVMLMVQGNDVELDESFDLVRARINQALTGTNHDGSKQDEKDRSKPLHRLSFKTPGGGKIAINPEKVIGVVEYED